MASKITQNISRSARTRHRTRATRPMRRSTLATNIPSARSTSGITGVTAEHSRICTSSSARPRTSRLEPQRKSITQIGQPLRTGWRCRLTVLRSQLATSASGMTATTRARKWAVTISRSRSGPLRKRRIRFPYLISSAMC